MQESPELASVRAATEAAFPEGAHMVSGHMQGRLFANLARLLGAQSVLEIGTFTGYSALCFAEGLPEVCTLLSMAWTDIPDACHESVGWERDFVKAWVGNEISAVRLALV